MKEEEDHEDGGDLHPLERGRFDMLRRYVKDETVDLVYLDPPFKSARSVAALAASGR